MSSISVLIATYGSEEWDDLGWSRAFPSAREQTEDVHRFHDPEGTIASVRNEVAAQAKGDWLCFLDADDELGPGYIEAMQRAVSEREVLGGSLLLTPAVNHKGRFWTEKPIEESNWLCVGTLVPRKLFGEVGGFPDYPHGYEDWALWVRCVKAGAEIIKVPNAVYMAHRTGTGREDWGSEWQTATHKRIFAELFPEA